MLWQAVRGHGTAEHCTEHILPGSLLTELQGAPPSQRYIPYTLQNDSLTLKLTWKL